jgi:signal transduction histidine kinase/CheY-like chemotaxis protein
LCHFQHASNNHWLFIPINLDYWKPFTVTCGNLIHAFNQISENKYLIDTLEDSVKKRTKELELTNIELEEANRLVLQANKMQLQHFACMSHEIRTPLNCVIGMASVLQESKLTAMQSEAVGMIVSSGELLSGIINDVLDYSKYETESVNVHKQTSNLQDTITLVLNSIISKAQSTQSVQSFLDVKVPELIHTDTRRLQQILFNLLGNAIKFSPPDGIIRLGVEMIPLLRSNDEEMVKYKMTMAKESDKNANLKCNVQQMLRFTVEDNGKGIDENDLHRIFQPFQQASSTEENIHGGTGLGLSITQKIVSALGGTISVASKKGQWSKFTVDIPCQDAPVTIQNISNQVKNYTVHIVGFSEVEKERVDRIMQTFNVESSHFSSLVDMLNAYKAKALHTENVHIVLLHEDCYDEERSFFLSDSIVITFGPKFRVKEHSIDFHVHSLQHLLPSYFINRILQSVCKKKQQKEATTAKDVFATSIEKKESSYSAMKVLIAEDNVVNQKVLTRMLHKLNVRNVSIVENGLEACKREEQNTYDLIFMDQQMPIMGGVAACRQILDRYNGNTQNQPCPTIVFVTAHVSDDFKNECRKAGGSGFVPKPFNLRIIEQILQSVYEQRLTEIGTSKR